VDHYNQVLKLPTQKIKKELNNFKIERTAFCAFDQRPYIPGSAVKGALRTAYLNSLADKGKDYSSYIENLNQRNIKNRRNRKPEIKVHKKLEEKLLHLDRVSNNNEKINKDPFRLVKVSDFMPVGDIKTKICYAVNKKKKMSDSEAKRLTQILEIIQPGSLFVGEIIVNAPQTRDAVSCAIELKNLLDSSHLFYGKEKSREDRELNNIKIVPPETHRVKDIKLIRVGRHSGAESVTIEKYRDIKIKLNRGHTFKDHATTLWFASEARKPDHNKFLSPFGWAVMSPLTLDMEEQLKVDEAVFQNNLNQALIEEKRKQEELILQKKQDQDRRQKEKQQEEEIRKAKEQRAAELEAMTPEQRILAELGDSSILENRVVEIYNKIDEFSEENKRAIAMALKKYWERFGKWKKKNCSKKQRIKVQKIKEILEES